MFITTNRIYEPPQDDGDSLRNEESEAVPEFANEENMVHEERQDGQGSEGEQDTEGNMTKQHLVASEEQDEEELRAIQIESQSIMAAEGLSHEHASRHVPQLGMKFKTTERRMIALMFQEYEAQETTKGRFLFQESKAQERTKRRFLVHRQHLILCQTKEKQVRLYQPSAPLNLLSHYRMENGE